MNNDTVIISSTGSAGGKEMPLDWADMVKTVNDFLNEPEEEDAPEREVDHLVSVDRSPLAARIVARLDRLFRERYRPEDHKHYAEAPRERLDAAFALLGKVTRAAQKSPGPWLDVELELPDYLAIALLEAVEAVDATDARHIRKREPLLGQAEGNFHSKCATAIHKRCVTCRHLAQLAHVVKKAMQSKFATRGDPSFLWRRGEALLN